MWHPFSSRPRSLPRPRRASRRKITSLERLEERLVLSYADFALNSLLPANGGDGSQGFAINGAVDNGRLGTASYAYHRLGDVNGDGLEDVLLAATGSVAVPVATTYVYVIFGRANGFPADLDLASLDGVSGYTITGLAGDRAGYSGGGVGDVNRDGVPDFAIMADGQTPSGDDLIGDRSYALFGGAAHLAALDLADGVRDGRINLAAVDGAHGFVISGEPQPGANGSALMSRIIGAGDVNGDDVDDIVIGDGYYGSVLAPGKAFVVFGRDSTKGSVFPAEVQLAALNGSDGFAIPGLRPQDLLGVSIGGGGDVNGDGIGDLVLGAMMASPSGKLQAGRAFVIFGRTSFPATFDLTTLNGANGFAVNGAAANDYLGGYTADLAGDVNGDGLDDVLLTAWNARSGSTPVGAAYVIFGKNTSSGGPFASVLEISTLNGSNGFVIRGLPNGGYVGMASRAGDVNGDGFDDVILGSWNADAAGLTDSGQSYMVYGQPSFGASFDLAGLLAANGGDGSTGYALNGGVTSGNAGYVAGIGDINGDGFDDVRISAPSIDSNGLTDNGRVYIVYGKSSPAPSTKFYVVNDGGPDRTYEYTAIGTAGESYAINTGNTAPRGAASTAAGDKVWVVDANKKVYVYNTSGGLLGSWTAGTLASNATVEGITTNGTDVWIVDAKQDKVFRYTGAASRLAGSQNAASSFSLNSGNADPKDIVTDGTSLWVVNDSSTDKVFKYSLTGSLLGSWTITGAGSSPTGITLDPTGGGTLWTVDSGTDRVYQFDNARGLTSGSLSPSTSFALAAGNTNPQGIADPPVPTQGVLQVAAVHRTALPSGRLAAQHRRSLTSLGTSKPSGSDLRSTAASRSILGPQLAPVLIPWTPSIAQDFALTTTELYPNGTKRARHASRG